MVSTIPRMVNLNHHPKYPIPSLELVYSSSPNSNLSTYAQLQLAHFSASVAFALRLIFAGLSKFIYITHRNKLSQKRLIFPIFRRTFPSLQGVWPSPPETPLLQQTTSLVSILYISSSYVALDTLRHLQQNTLIPTLSQVLTIKPNKSLTKFYEQALIGQPEPCSGLSALFCLSH